VLCLCFKALFDGDESDLIPLEFQHETHDSHQLIFSSVAPYSHYHTKIRREANNDPPFARLLDIILRANTSARKNIPQSTTTF
jgi:hypothetical protein